MAAEPGTDGQLIAQLCADFERWAPEERCPPQLRSGLSGGFSNRSYLLGGQRSDYVLRVASPPAPGVDRRREQQLLQAAGAAGIGPETLLCLPERGILITRYLSAAGPDTASSDSLRALARLLREIHALPRFGDSTSSADALARYRGRVPRGGPAARLLAIGGAALSSAIQAVTGQPGSVVTCHNDLLQANRRSLAGRLVAVDWEYAATGDAFFDIAVAASELPGGTAGDTLLEAYLQRKPTPGERHRLRSQRLIYAALACCWFEDRLPDSPGATEAARAFMRQLDAWTGSPRAVPES